MDGISVFAQMLDSENKMSYRAPVLQLRRDFFLGFDVKHRFGGQTCNDHH